MANEPEYGPVSHGVPPVDPQAPYTPPAGQPPYPPPGGYAQDAQYNQGAPYPGQASYTQRPYTPQAGGGLASNVAAGLAYITIIPAIIFLVIEPYKRDPLVRFHSWQSIFLTIGALVIHILEGFLFTILPGFVGLAVSSLVSLAIFAIWLIAMIQAFQGRMWQIPVIGGFAAQQASGRPTAV